MNDEAFERIEFLKPEPSVYATWPTKKQSSSYKLSTFWFSLHPSMTTIERQTYSFLDWLGDVGGLLDGLKIIGSILIAPIASFTMKVELLKRS